MRKRKEGMIMINKLFLAVAKKMNSSVSPLLRLSDKLSEPAYRKATIKTFKNGNRLIDADILMANRMKITVCMYAVGSIAGVIAKRIANH